MTTRVTPTGAVHAVLLATVCALTLGPGPAGAQVPAATGALAAKWEELTSPDFATAVERAGRTAIIPVGIIEKHGPHLPLGTDLLDAREVALRATAREYALVFPPYYVGQIFEARHQPGTIAYSERLVWDMLQATIDEIARNGITKIVLVNGHGGNTNFLRFFCQAQLAQRRIYALYLFEPSADAETSAAVKALRRTTMDMHAGETETSTIMAHRPDRPPGAGQGSVRRRPGSPRRSEGRLHRHLVVREIPESLRRRRHAGDGPTRQPPARLGSRTTGRRDPGCEGRYEDARTAAAILRRSREAPRAPQDTVAERAASRR